MKKILPLKNFPTIVFVIFAFAIFVRLLYLNENVYFSFDQARDSFFALDILKGDVRLIGPPSAASTSLFAGPLSLYLYSIIYFIFGENPEILSIFFRVYNAFGVFLVFIIGNKIFGKKVATLSSFLFAISYEQSQYSLFMSHQPLAILPVLLFYLGLVLLISDKNQKGLFVSMLGLGLSIQFHYVYLLLIPIFFLIIIFFRKSIPKLKIKFIVISVATFLIGISTYIFSEIKFDFQTLRGLGTLGAGTSFRVNEALLAVNRFFHDTFYADYKLTPIVIILIIAGLFYFKNSQDFSQKRWFLLFWLVGGILPYLLSGTSSYYYSAAATVSLLIIFSFFVFEINKKIPILSLILIGVVIFNNLNLIISNNPNGPNKDIVIQPGMVLKNEKAAIDYMYKNFSENFSVKSIGIPLQVNTTWSYLFEWYGKEKYGFIPTWIGKPAEGFPGNLEFETKRSDLPKTQYVVIEPLIGVQDSDISIFFREENYFTKLVEEKKFGTITVQKRIKI